MAVRLAVADDVESIRRPASYGAGLGSPPERIAGPIARTPPLETGEQGLQQRGHFATFVTERDT